MTNKLIELARSVLNKTNGTLEERIRAKFQKRPLKKSMKVVDFPPGPLDANLHHEQRWKGHEPQVYHGLNPDRNFMKPSEKGVSHQIRFIGDHQPKAVIKAPLDETELKLPKGTKDGPETSYMLHPSFRTSHREAAYHLLADKVFGLGDFVPKTTVFKHPASGEPWSAQQFIPHADTLVDPHAQLHRYKNSNELHKIALMDAILGHNDRHGKNALVDRAGRIHLIDNASAFDYSHRFQTPTPKYVLHTQFEAASPGTHRWLNGLSEKALTERMVQAGAPTDTINTALKRLAEAKRWSRALSANPEASQELRGGLQVIQTHRHGESSLLDESRKLTYNRIRRGSSASAAPSSDPDQTQIPERK